MPGLPVDWMPYTPEPNIPEGYILDQNMAVPVCAFNALSAQGFFQAPSVLPQANDESSMPVIFWAQSGSKSTIKICSSFPNQGELLQNTCQKK
ncbi:hypothetical protein DSO57_1017311 [Entomophthora muscae]|uniref:Uncharacterized protein n=1 Tax=Entomophthora muscae TaxID=34485 RepID=A0ACC2S6V3_9FUNG|nr:hypothetical protein DSO57_1017311 [Entomophthora muscae]